MKLLKHFATIICLVHSATGQGLFDFFGFGMGGGTADLFGPAQTFDPWMSGGGGGMGGGMNGGGFGGGFGAGTGGAGGYDPAAQDARLTMAEEQMAEVMGESPRNSPERQRIDNLIQASGGQFTGDAAPLNYLVKDYLMTTPGPALPQEPAPVAGGKQAGGRRLQKQRQRNRNGQGRRNNGLGNRRNRNGLNQQAVAGTQQPPAYPTAAGKMGTRKRGPRPGRRTNLNQVPAYRDPLYQSQPNANNQNYQPQPTAYQDPLYQPQPTAYQDPLYQPQPTAYQDPSYQPQPTAYQDPMYQTQPTANNQNYRPQPPANNGNYQPQPPANNRNYQPQPPANNQNYQPQPTSNNQNYQPQPTANNQNYRPQSAANNGNYQPQPPANNQNYRPQPPANNQNYQPQATANNQNYQPQPSANNQNYQPQPPVNNQNYQPQPPAYQAAGYKPQPPPNNQMYQAQPPTNNRNYQNQPQNYPAQQPASVNQGPYEQQAQTKTKSATRRSKGPTKRVTKTSVTKSRQESGPIAVNRLRGIEERITSVKDQLFNAQQINDVAQIQNLQGQLEALNGVKNILTGGTSNTNKMETIRGRPVGKSSGPSKQASPMTTQRPYGPPKLNRNNRSGNNYNNPPNYNNFQETNVGGQLVQTWKERPQKVQNNVNRQPSTQVDIAQYHNAAPSPDPYAPAYDPSMNSLQYYDTNTLAYDQGMNQPGGGFANNAPRRRKQRRGKGKRRGFKKAPMPPAPTTPAGTTVPPKLGDVRWVGNEQYIYYDADGFDTFQWVKKSTIPAGQLDHIQQNQAAQEGAPAQEGAQGQGQQQAAA